jgi:hypothetical protein
VEKGELCPSAGKPKTLSAAQLKTALELLQTEPPSDGNSPGCWNPHHGIEFLNAEGGRIAFVAVSFECQSVIRRGKEQEPLSDEVQASWRALFKALGLGKNLKTQ